MPAKSAYELSASQVSTPQDVVAFFWSLVKQRRDALGRVLDLGAGDCRFAKGGTFKKYLGIEIDRAKAKAAKPPRNGKIINGCAFKHADSGYDACIGNPPYVRHHDIEQPWKHATAISLERSLSVELNQHCNLYLYFLCLALLKTSEKGLVAFVIPFEWVSRPSAKPIRELIAERKWNVDVYRFRMPIFDGVLTTASISIIDKAAIEGKWSYYDVGSDFRIKKRGGPTTSGAQALAYASRGKIWAMRGMSPGSQQLFTLTEGERVHHGLKSTDVVPCVTTLRHVPSDVNDLTDATFKRHFVDAGARCWLVRSYEKSLSDALKGYLSAVPRSARDNYTCRQQSPWYNFPLHARPQLFAASGFTEFGPKILINKIDAYAVGAVTGVYAPARVSLKKLQNYLHGIDFGKYVVPHAKTLKKVEVRQLNAVLNDFRSAG